ncbi:MAG: hypothetical protein E6I10_02010 [Chloroflexi bacterium]|nr:MAG: hypothetical protein E6I10_02010 [Chloroflexota bacterium]
MKFIPVFVGVVLLALLALSVGSRFVDPARRDPGVEANARLISYASVALLIPLIADVITGIRPGLLAHALIGFLLVPLVLLKLGSVGYRFLRYYAGDPRYRAAGPPALVMRLSCSPPASSSGCSASDLATSGSPGIKRCLSSGS